MIHRGPEAWLSGRSKTAAAPSEIRAALTGVTVARGSVRTGENRDVVCGVSFLGPSSMMELPDSG